MNNDIWFRKSFNATYWRPISWQGWLVTAIWIGSNLWYIRSHDFSSLFVGDSVIKITAFFIVSTVSFLIIVRHTSDRNWI